jgi:hypothetical protein
VDWILLVWTGECGRLMRNLLKGRGDLKWLENCQLLKNSAHVVKHTQWLLMSFILTEWFIFADSGIRTCSDFVKRFEIRWTKTQGSKVTEEEKRCSQSVMCDLFPAKHHSVTRTRVSCHCSIVTHLCSEKLSKIEERFRNQAWMFWRGDWRNKGQYAGKLSGFDSPRRCFL